MANEVTIINGVTKKERNGAFRYRFGANVHIDAYPSDNSMIIFDIDKHKNHKILFDDITDKLGATNIEQYVDALAAGGYYQTTVTGDLSVTIDPTGLATEAKQDAGNASLASIDTKLDSQATAENQAAANASLASIDAKTANTAVSSDVNNTVLNNIAEKLDTIIYLLKSIAE